MTDTIEPEIEDDAASRWEGLRVRVVSGLALMALFLAALWMGGWFFTVLIMAAALIALREWDGLTSDGEKGWTLAGLVYIGIPCASLIWLREVRFVNNPNAGLELVLFIMCIVWATDIGAYFAGRKIGGPKLAPVISPNKTWAGLGGGIVAAAVIAVLAFFTPYPTSLVSSAFLGAVLAVIAQAGDLFESWLKRRVGAKDSGTLIPGHGGLLDRIDGLMFTVPIFAWLVYMSGNCL